MLEYNYLVNPGRASFIHSFTQMAADTLDSCRLQELADISPEAKPLRRRAALLLGQWVVKLSAEGRPAAYRALLSLMADHDTALQLAAVSSIVYVVVLVMQAVGDVGHVPPGAKGLLCLIICPGQSMHKVRLMTSVAMSAGVQLKGID